MPRIARIVIPGCPHHITQRGNNRQDVFFVDDDRQRYLAILAAQAERFGLTVQGYCLMTNHVHLIATPREPESLAKAVGRTHWLYTQYVNRLHGRSGHLWQNRFYSCALDEPHFYAAMIYVERNPVRARLVRRAWRYPWSSAAAHCDGRDPTDTERAPPACWTWPRGPKGCLPTARGATPWWGRPTRPWPRRSASGRIAAARWAPTASWRSWSVSSAAASAPCP